MKVVGKKLDIFVKWELRQRAALKRSDRPMHVRARGP